MSVDWDIFQFPDLSPEEAEKQKKETRELDLIRADYRYVCKLQAMSDEELRGIIANGPFPVNPETGKQYEESDYQEDHLRTMGARYLHRHRQAVIVLEERAAKPRVDLSGLELQRELGADPVE